MPSHTADELNHLRATAEHQRQQADVLADAVSKIQGKVDKARVAYSSAVDQLEQAKRDAEQQDLRARDAEITADEAGAPAVAIPSMVITARPTP
jgi:hypothetical protein